MTSTAVTNARIFDGERVVHETTVVLDWTRPPGVTVHPCCSSDRVCCTEKMKPS